MEVMFMAIHLAVDLVRRLRLINLIILSPPIFLRQGWRCNQDIEELVTQAAFESGLESSNLILGIDFTKSNVWTGRDSFNGRCLHDTKEDLNPYENAISIIGRVLSDFDEDNLIPCFGFGDVSTHDQNVFSFYPDNRPCNGFEEALSRYREIIPSVRLSGPTSFAPIIETAKGIVDASGGLYHVLLIITEGQVTGIGQLSTQEQHTVNAIVKASEYALSIIVVGVGDGPWDKMRKFDDNIPARAFDNFQFVNFTEIMSRRNVPLAYKEAEFALSASMKIPIQFRAIQELHLLSTRRGHDIVVPLPPPSRIQRSTSSSYFSPTNSFSKKFSTSCLPSLVSTKSSSNRTCPICLTNRRDLAFGSVQTCHDCGNELTWCPICRTEITTTIRLFD